jgi:hypothetical protein
MAPLDSFIGPSEDMAQREQGLPGARPNIAGAAADDVCRPPEQGEISGGHARWRGRRTGISTEAWKTIQSFMCLPAAGALAANGVTATSTAPSRAQGNGPAVLDEDRYGGFVSPKHERCVFRRWMWSGLLRTCLKIRFASRPRPRPSSSSSKFPGKPRTKDEDEHEATTPFSDTLCAAAPRAHLTFLQVNLALWQPGGLRRE